MKLLVTGSRGFLGSRIAELLEASGHEIVRVARPGGTVRAAAPEAVEIDAGDPAVRRLLEGCDAVLHFAGVPDPARSLADPARAVRENVGTTVNLLQGCLEHGCGLVYPSTVRAGVEPPPDPYALSKRLGEAACRLHPAPATAVRLTSVFGPGQVAWEGATGAIATFAARALEGAPIVLQGDPDRVRDFVYVDDVAPALAALVVEGRWNETLELASGVATPLRRAAELVNGAAGAGSSIETRGGTLAPGEDSSYPAGNALPRVSCAARALEEVVPLYVDWLRRHPAAKGRGVS